MSKPKKILWKCPGCGATASTHGKGGCASSSPRDECEGFLCECVHDTEADHGETREDPCTQANCYHCGWGGTFPVPLFDVKKLRGWAKQAHAAGWTPPPGWKP